MTPPLSLDKIAELTYGRLPRERQFGLDNWKCHLLRNKYDLFIIVNDNVNKPLRGMVIAYMMTDRSLFVNWCICEDGAALEQFCRMLRSKFPAARELIFDRRGKMKTYNVDKFLKHYGK